MQSALMVILIISGILFIWSVMFMSPKWGLWVGLGGMAGWGEYGSKKSVENTLKKVAVVAAIVFVITAVCYPYVGA
jgi:protein translocase SecG subunit